MFHKRANWRSSRTNARAKPSAPARPHDRSDGCNCGGVSAFLMRRRARRLVSRSASHLPAARMVLPFLLVLGRFSCISLHPRAFIPARANPSHLGHMATSALVANVEFMAQALKSSEEKRRSRLSGRLPGASALRRICRDHLTIGCRRRVSRRRWASGAQILGQAGIVKSDRAVPSWRSDHS